MKAVLPLVLAAALLGGCASPVTTAEPGQLQLIETLGLDGRPGTAALSVSSGPDPTGKEPFRRAAEGRSVSEAIVRLQEFSGREELFFAHVRFAVLGEAAARDGLGALLDWFERSTQTTLTVPLFVVRGGEARGLVCPSETPEFDAAEQLASLQRDAERIGSPHCDTLLKIARQLSRSGTALSAAVELVSGDEGGAPVARPAGLAVWKAGRLRGFLDRDAALGADLMRGLSPRASLVLPVGEKVLVTAELRRCRVSAERAEKNGVAAACVALDIRAGILEAEGLDRTDGETLRRIEEALAQAVLVRAEAALRETQAMDADAMELCRALSLPAEEYASLPWRIVVRAAAERSFDIAESGGVGP